MEQCNNDNIPFMEKFMVSQDKYVIFKFGGEL